MIKKLNEILKTSRECFSRKSTYEWFVIMVTALMIGQEHIGVTSIIRELWLDPLHYAAALHFFRSTGWRVDAVRAWWIRALIATGVLYSENGRFVLVGDGTKKSKEGKKMPCVKRLHQESENSSKPTYIFGHMFGMIGVLAGNAGKLFCIALSMSIHDGDKEIHQWDTEPAETQHESHVVRIIRDAAQAVKTLGKSLLLLDAYYLTVPALTALAEEGRDRLNIVVRAKRNATAYQLPVRKQGRGRPPKKGAKIKLMDLWHDSMNARTETVVTLYGKKKGVSFLARDLLWGQKHYQPLRFLIARISGSTPIILASTDLTLSAEQILRLYSCRFKIECSFFNLKHTVAGFAYRFWSHATPKLNRFAKSGTDVLVSVSKTRDQRLITAAFRATQAYVTTACVATGLLQVCSLLFADEINASPLRWLRTRTNRMPSEASTAEFIRKTIFKHVGLKTNFEIIRLIQQRQPKPAGSVDSLLA